MTRDADKPAQRTPEKPGRSARGQEKAAEKYARQAEALRANLRRRQQQRRGQQGVAQDSGEPDGE